MLQTLYSQTTYLKQCHKTILEFLLQIIFKLDIPDFGRYEGNQKLRQYLRWESLDLSTLTNPLDSRNRICNRIGTEGLKPQQFLATGGHTLLLGRIQVTARLMLQILTHTGR
jgi:hypothetical protein